MKPKDNGGGMANRICPISHSGKEISESMDFCPHCSSKLTRQVTSEKTIRSGINWKIVGLVIVIIVIFGAAVSVYLATLNSNAPLTINDSLNDGEVITWTIEGYGSRLSVGLSSLNDYMYVKVLVDGQLVYDQNNIYQANFEHTMSFGKHVVQITIQNPAAFLNLGSGIIVTGAACLSI